MASKGKDKSKPKNHEIEFNKKRIDLKRFAYDVMKFTALKFRVPESCIAVWEGSENDYGSDDFCLVVCRRIIHCQITHRYRFHIYFRKHYESNKLATPKLIGILLQEVIKNETDEQLMTPVDKVEFSLSVVCELFLFLYSKTISMNPRQLATFWFQCYLNINKKQFETAGGLQQMYLKGSKRKFDNMDAFIDKFIEDQCLPYDTTANDPDLKEFFCLTVDERIRMYAESLSEKDREEMEEFMHLNEKYKSQLMSLNIDIGEAAFGFDVPQNTERIPGDKALQLQNPSVTSPQDPTAASPEEQPRHRRTLSCKQRKMMKASSRASVEQGIGQASSDSSLTKQSSQKKPNVSVAEVATLSYNLLGAKPKDREQNTGSSGSQTGESSLCSSVEQGGQFSSDSSVAIDTTQSYKRHRAKPKVREQNTGSSGLQTGESSLCLSVEQGIGQLSLDCSERKSDILAADDPRSQRHSGASHQEAKKVPRESSSQEEKRKRKSKK